MNKAPASNQLSRDQRAAIAYVKANPGCTTRSASIALERGRAGMLSTFQVLEGRGLIRSHWPNRAGNDSWEWTFVKELEDA